MTSAKAFSAAIDDSKGGLLRDKQSQAAFSYVIDSLSNRRALSGTTSTRHANAKIANSKDSHERGASSGFWRKLLYSSSNWTEEKVQNSCLAVSNQTSQECRNITGKTNAKYRAFSLSIISQLGRASSGRSNVTPSGV